MKNRKQQQHADSDKESTTSDDSAGTNKVVRYGDSTNRFDLVLDNGIRTMEDKNKNGKKKEDMLEIHLDGPFGAPASNIFKAEHAVLVATGIGVTPFSSILQSLMFRYRESKRECPRCHLRWLTDLGKSMQSLRKVDFFWINRDQKSFEWFLKLLSVMEAEQQEEEEAVSQIGDHSSIGR